MSLGYFAALMTPGIACHPVDVTNVVLRQDPLSDLCVKELWPHVRSRRHESPMSHLARMQSALVKVTQNDFEL